MIEQTRRPKVTLGRPQIIATGGLIVLMLGIALGAMALGRASVRAARPVITYSTEAAATWRVSDPSGANGREAPGFAEEIVHRFAFGDAVAATGSVADVQDETWREVNLANGKTAWVRTALLSGFGEPPIPPTVPPVTTPPATDPPPTTPTTQPTPTTVPARPVFGTEQVGVYDVTSIATGESLNVRAEPGTGSPVVARLAANATAIKSTGHMARIDTATWRQVEYATGKTGWVNAAFLEVHVEAPVYGSEKAARWDVTGLDPTGSLNVRKGPGTTNDVIAKLAPNAVDIASTGRVATVSGALWREVKYDTAGRTGWVSARYLKAHVEVKPETTAPPRGVAVMGDWNGNGVSTPAIFANGSWYIRLSNAAGPADLVFAFGEKADRPVAGDWNGDGIDTIGVVRNGTWFLRNTNSAGTADVKFDFGQAGDIPIAGDWNGDGVDTPGVFRKAAWYLRNSNSTGAADVTFEFGNAADVPVVGDWNSDGTDTAGVVRGDRWLLRNSNGAGSADIDFLFGNSGDTPVSGDWNGDGSDAAGMARGSAWFLRNHASSGSADFSFKF